MEAGLRCLRILRPQALSSFQTPVRRGLLTQAIRQKTRSNRSFLPRTFPRQNTTATSAATTSSIDSQNPAENISKTVDQESEPQKAKTPLRDEKVYLLSFECTPCTKRSIHRITHHGYHRGTVLISCPHCKQRHLISDHLKIFSDTSVTLETILAEKGDVIRKGTLDLSGDFEYWSKDSIKDSIPEREIKKGGIRHTIPQHEEKEIKRGGIRYIMSQQEEKEMDDEFEGKIRKVIADVPQKHSEQENEGIPEDKVTVSLVKPRKEPEHDPLGKWAQISDGKLLGQQEPSLAKSTETA